MNVRTSKLFVTFFNHSFFESLIISFINQRLCTLVIAIIQWLLRCMSSGIEDIYMVTNAYPRQYSCLTLFYLNYCGIFFVVGHNSVGNMATDKLRNTDDYKHIQNIIYNWSCQRDEFEMSLRSRDLSKVWNWNLMYYIASYTIPAEDDEVEKTDSIISKICWVFYYRNMM